MDMAPQVLHSLHFQLVVNQPYDESLEVNDDEEVASTFTPSPRPPGGKTSRGYNPGMCIR